ncbi:LuxE/PaaK family acyltransferase [Roseomonas elaeocarpi]|uniref:Long-chain fatty acid--CoA ligase n=1 Tax=Roseomonas elaeocarpi TaxID=907779 RepID=A0ABV6JVJ3_9PROT
MTVVEEATPLGAETALRARVEALMDLPAPDEAAFEALALAIFAFQFEHDPAYRRFARQRGRSPRTVRSWREIPAVPINAFKDLDLGCTPPGEAARTFMTSGTTRAGRRGRVFHRSLDLYDRSMRLGFEHFFMRGAARMPMAVLFPDEAALPNSSLAHYLALAIRHYGAPGSRVFMDADGIDLPALLTALRGAEASGEPFALLGASYSFVQLLDQLEAGGRRFRLPPGSRIFDTGGFKGQSREVPPELFYARLTAAFGVPAELCINMYGMTELSSQFYDDGNARQPSVKRAMPWLRSRVVDPLTGRDAPHGTPGVLAHHDLAHLGVVSAILTEDLGVMQEDGFVLLGRVGGAEAKGCSLALEEFLGAARAPAAG